MARAPAGFPAAQQASLAKRVKMAVGGVKAAGERVGEVIISPEGVIRILTGSPDGADAPGRESRQALAEARKLERIIGRLEAWQNS